MTDTAQSITIKASPVWVTQKSDNAHGIEPARLTYIPGIKF